VATDCFQTLELILRKLNWNSTCVCVNDAHSVDGDIPRAVTTKKLLSCGMWRHVIWQEDRQTPNIVSGTVLPSSLASSSTVKMKAAC